MSRPFVLGLTGNIACGKSTVVAMLADLGAEVIDADRVYHDLIVPDAPLWHALRTRFGDGILAQDRQIDRRALGAIVFADPLALADLDALTHPAILAATQDRVAAAAAPVVVVDAVKLVESGYADDCDAVWLVVCDPAQQVERLARRNNLSRADAQRRVAAQPPLGPKLARADVVIDNNGTIAETRAQVDAAWTSELGPRQLARPVARNPGSPGLLTVPVAPVSSALRPARGRLGEQARRALAAIDRVHHDGALPTIPLDDRRGNPGFKGEYRFKANSGKVIGISTDASGPVPEFAILHEIGHLLDHQGLGRPGAFASRRHPDLDDWRRAVQRTVSYRRLRDWQRADPLDLTLRYLLKYTELWARSYAEYVTLKSQDQLLAQQLVDEQAAPAPYGAAHWDDNDFVPVQQAIDQLFWRKGWLR